MLAKPSLHGLASLMWGGKSAITLLRRPSWCRALCPGLWWIGTGTESLALVGTTLSAFGSCNKKSLIS